MGEVIKALVFMALGGVIVEVFEIHAWRRYRQGKEEANDWRISERRSR